MVELIKQIKQTDVVTEEQLTEDVLSRTINSQLRIASYAGLW